MRRLARRERRPVCPVLAPRRLWLPSVFLSNFRLVVSAHLADPDHSRNNPLMEIHAWEKRYGSKERPAEDFEAAPVGLIETAEKLCPGRVLDLACGTGRNALWLAEHGWRVTAVDGASIAIRILRDRAS